MQDKFLLSGHDGTTEKTDKTYVGKGASIAEVNDNNSFVIKNGYKELLGLTETELVYEHGTLGRGGSAQETGAGGGGGGLVGGSASHNKYAGGGGGLSFASYEWSSIGASKIDLKNAVKDTYARLYDNYEDEFIYDLDLSGLVDTLSSNQVKWKNIKTLNFSIFGGWHENKIPNPLEYNGVGFMAKGNIGDGLVRIKKIEVVAAGGGTEE